MKKFYVVDLSGKDAVIKPMPDMNIEREELSLVIGPDTKLYAIGGYNNN